MFTFFQSVIIVFITLQNQSASSQMTIIFFKYLGGSVCLFCYCCERVLGFQQVGFVFVGCAHTTNNQSLVGKHDNSTFH
jgi:hypothetical protein